MEQILSIQPIKAFDDNYIWLIAIQDKTVCVDPGEACVVLDFLNQNSLKLDEIWITHEHHDHTGGVKQLLELYPNCLVRGRAEIQWVNQPVVDNQKFILVDEISVTVWFVPGHTQLHILYIVDNVKQQQLHVFCGDTLFSAGCGRVFTGTVQQLFDSLERINSLPASTLLYPAHEYTKSNLKFAQFVEPENEDIQQALSLADNFPTLPVTLEHERKINPFLRTRMSSVFRCVLQQNPNIEDEEYAEIFAILRELKNSF